MDRLVHTFIDTVTLFILQNDQLKINQTGFRSCPSNETALLSVTIALQIAKADSKSSVLILLVLSATFDTVNHQIFLLPSQELHSTGLNLISQVGLSGFPGEERYPKHINWSLGFFRDQFLDPSSSPYTLHHWDPLYKHMVSPTIAMLMTHSSIFHFNQTIQQ